MHEEGRDRLCERLGVAKLVAFDDLTELQDGVLLRRRGVVDGDVGDLCVPKGQKKDASQRTIYGQA